MRVEPRRRSQPSALIALSSIVTVVALFLASTSTTAPAYADGAGAAVAPLPTQELAPLCRTSGNRIVVVYAHDSESTEPAPVELIRSIIRRTNWKISDQSSLSSGGARAVKMVVECNSSGAIQVYDLEVPDFTSDTVKAALDADLLGYPTKADPNPNGTEAIKYLLLGPEGGLDRSYGLIADDSSKSVVNKNAVNTAVAVIGGGKTKWETHTPMHEMFHTFGAVQGWAGELEGGLPKAGLESIAPYSSYQRHCVDGADIMCYDDGGGHAPWGNYSNSYCPGSFTGVTIPIDCGKDTYFNAAPAAGTWLATHWNLAGPENPFLTVAPTQAPQATTAAATSVASGGATMQATITPKADYATYYFEYGPTTSYGTSVPVPSGRVPGFGSAAVNVSQAVAGLPAGTTYHYRVVAANDVGSVQGSDKTFTTNHAPVAVTEPAVVDPSNQSNVTLEGNVNPNGLSTTYQFEYGTTTAYGQKVPVPAKNVTTGKSEGGLWHVEEKLTGLSPNTTYHARLVATNADGSGDIGKDVSFTTGLPDPVVQAGPATGVTDRAAMLTGSIDTHGYQTSYSVEYGTTTAYGLELGGYLPDPTGIISIEQQVEDLQPNTTYHYRISAANLEQSSLNIVAGEDRTFTTGPPRPLAVLEAATGVEGDDAILHGTVNPEGLASTYHFEYVPDATFQADQPNGFANATSTASKSAGSGSSNVAVSEALTGLTPNTTYHVRLVATNANGTTYSKASTFIAPAPQVAIEAATGVEGDDAILHGTVNPEGLASTYHFEYVPDATFQADQPNGFVHATSTASKSAGSGSSSVAVSEAISGLSTNTTYHFRLVATNANGTSYSDPKTLIIPAWIAQSTPNPVPYDHSLLEDASCTSATSCVAVGNDDYRGTGFVQTWDGTSWSILQTLDNASFSGVSCSGNACLITGSKRMGELGATWRLPKILGGKFWGTVNQLTTPTPEGVSTVTLEDVSCSAETACTAVGYHSAGTLAMRWNGTAWTIQTTPSPSGGEGSGGRLLAVSCPTSTSCTAVGSRSSSGIQTFSERWNGSAWSIASVPKPAVSAEGRLEDVSCASTSACMAVGWFKESTNIATPRKGLSVSWNTSAWSTVATAVPSGAENGVTLTGISCTAANACTAVGRTGGVAPAFPVESTVAEVWNGSAWAVQSTVNPLAYSRLSAVSCTSSSACTAVGQKRPGNYSAGTQTLVERWDGSSWSTQATPNPIPYDHSLLEDTSCLSATSCVAVGNDDYRGTGFVQTWDGTSWSILQTLDDARFTAVSCSGNTCLITGSRRASGLGATWKLPKILSGKFWGTVNQLTTPTPAGVSTVILEDVSCSAETACTAVGHYYFDAPPYTYVPLAMRWNGTAWTIQTTPNPSGGEGDSGKLLAVSCPTSTSCTAVGSRSSSGIQTFSERWNGTTWSIASVPKPAGSVEGRLEGVSCATAAPAWRWAGSGKAPASPHRARASR